MPDGHQVLVNALTGEVENRAKNHLYDYPTYQELAVSMAGFEISITEIPDRT